MFSFSKGNNNFISEFLINEGIITHEQLKTGLREQENTGGFICGVLVRLGLTSEDKIFSALLRELNIPHVKFTGEDIDEAVIKLVPVKIAVHYKIIPLKVKDSCLIIAMRNPQDMDILDDIRLLLCMEVRAVSAFESDICEAIRRYYGVGADTLEKIIEQESKGNDFITAREKTQDLKGLTEDASIIRFVNQIMLDAVKERATDIHIEPFHNELRVRFRIDGILYDVNIPESIKYFHPAIVSRIKIMAELDIAEHRFPQDGRIKIKVDGDESDLRISILPTAFGEAVHIRRLSPQFLLELDNLGLSEDNLRIIERVIKKPHGIVLVNGPTGSGKTTTLYACLSYINSSEVKIITIEDPIEYQLRGVNQVQIIHKIGFNFAAGLRHILRHDPDVMMVGEIRDCETAEIAVRAALTGHLVFSTLHTNDAAGAITRLLEMGIAPFLAASSLECLIAQRLVRIICPECKMAVKLPKEILKQIEKDIEFYHGSGEFYAGKGCEACRFTCYNGRTGIHEILFVTESIRKLILNHASSQQIKQEAVCAGMRTLRQDGLQKFLAGITTFEEVMRVTQEEEKID